MSISPDFSEAGRFSSKETMKPQEKSNFSQTCSLLSQYVKERAGSFGDLSLGMTRNLEGRAETFYPTSITRNFSSPIMEVPRNVSPFSGLNNNASATSVTREVRSMDLFPQHAGFGPSPPSMDAFQNKADFRTPKEPETSQMTIFYGGKVIVFDDLPAEKAKEIMLLASKSSSPNYSGSVFPSTFGNDHRQISSNFTATTIVNNSINMELPPRPHGPIVSDLPIARKASLHRFLEKRKDRISAKAPYQITQNYSVSAAAGKAPANVAESKKWLGLAPQSQQQLMGFQL